MKKKIFIVLMLLFSYTIYGEDLRARGTGKTPREAKQNALANLSEQIKVVINTRTESQVEMDKDELMKDHFLNESLIKSTNKFYGIKYGGVKKENGEYCETAILNEESLKEFEKHLTAKKEEILRDFKKTEKLGGLKSKQNNLEEILESLKNIEEEEDSYLVLQKLLNKNIKYKKLDETRVKIEINGEKRSVFLEKFAVIELIENIKRKNSNITLGISLEDEFKKISFLEEYPSYLKKRVHGDLMIGDLVKSTIKIVIKEYGEEYNTPKNETTVNGKIEMFDMRNNDNLLSFPFSSKVIGKGERSIKLAILKELQYGKSGEKLVKEIKTLLK